MVLRYAVDKKARCCRSYVQLESVRFIVTPVQRIVY